jgi:hypothetical protein
MVTNVNRPSSDSEDNRNQRARWLFFKKWILRMLLGFWTVCFAIYILVALLPESVQKPLKQRCLPRADFQTQVGWLAIAAVHYAVHDNVTTEECFVVRIDTIDGIPTLTAVTRLRIYKFEKGISGIWHLKSKRYYHMGIRTLILGPAASASLLRTCELDTPTNSTHGAKENMRWTG